METKPLRKILGSIRKAVDDYDMIGDGDSVAVGLSGGKDSLALTAALAVYRKFSPVNFTLSAINVDMGLKGTEAERERLAAFVKELDVPYYEVKTDIAEIVFDVRRRRARRCCLSRSTFHRNSRYSYRTDPMRLFFPAVS